MKKNSEIRGFSENSHPCLFLVSGFREKDLLRIGKKYKKLLNYSIKNTDDTVLVQVSPRNINTKFEANSCSNLKEEITYVILQNDIE